MEAVSFDIGLTYHLPYLGNVSYTSMAHTKMFITYINKRKTTMFNNIDIFHEQTFKEKDLNTRVHIMVPFK